MLRFALLRILSAVPTLLFVIVLTFALLHAAPGGPFDAERQAPAEVLANIERNYRLDEPVHQQFLRYFGNLLQGDLGPSYRYVDRDVATIIGDAFPLSFALGGMAMVLALCIGLALGLVAALRRNTLTDRLVSALAMTGISIPVFVVAPLLVLFFAVNRNWLPAGFVGNEGVSRFVLPVVALALPQIAYVARLFRASMIETLDSDFIRTARSQGLKQSVIVRHHALKPALLPLISWLGPAIAAVLTGSVVIEQVFGIPGLGQFFVNGALNRDYTLVMGLVIFYAALIIVLNLCVDLAYGFLDPRIRRA